MRSGARRRTPGVALSHRSAHTPQERLGRVRGTRDAEVSTATARLLLTSDPAACPSRALSSRSRSAAPAAPVVPLTQPRRTRLAMLPPSQVRAASPRSCAVAGDARHTKGPSRGRTPTVHSRSVTHRTHHRGSPQHRAGGTERGFVAPLLALRASPPAATPERSRSGTWPGPLPGGGALGSKRARTARADELDQVGLPAALRLHVPPQQRGEPHQLGGVHRQPADGLVLARPPAVRLARGHAPAVGGPAPCPSPRPTRCAWPPRRSCALPRRPTTRSRPVLPRSPSPRGDEGTGSAGSQAKVGCRRGRLLQKARHCAILVNATVALTTTPCSISSSKVWLSLTGRCTTRRSGSSPSRRPPAQASSAGMLPTDAGRRIA